jgi:hypothetical protein
MYEAKHRIRVLEGGPSRVTSATFKSQGKNFLEEKKNAVWYRFLAKLLLNLMERLWNGL